MIAGCSRTLTVCFTSVQINDRANKIFVGGIDVNTTEEDLTAFFSQFGKVWQFWWVIFDPEFIVTYK